MTYACKTRARTVLDLLREQPRTFDELLELTGLSKSIVRTALCDLRRSGYMEPVPTTYATTTKAEQGGKPKIAWAPRDNQIRLPRVQKAKPRKPQKTMADKVVAKARRTRSPLEQAWGVFGGGAHA